MGAHSAFIDDLLDVVRDERVDAVLISGDLYDRAVPNADAVELFNDALTRLVRQVSVRVVAISGNHDSPRRLGFGSNLIDAAGVHLRTNPADVGTPVVFNDEHGDVACYAIPYLEPAAAPPAWEVTERGHTGVLSAAMDRVRRDLAGRRARSVVLAHAFVTGGQAGDAERDISVGGVANVPTSVFDGVDYVGLGHLHGQQRLTDRLRYSGSPLAFSFSEAAHTKGSLLVDLGAHGVSQVEFVPAPVPRRMARISGTLDALLTDRRYGEYEDRWLEVTLTDEVRPVDPGPRLSRRFPHVLRLTLPSIATDPRFRETVDLASGSPVEAALSFVHEVRGRDADQRETALLRRAFDEVRVAERELTTPAE